MEPIILGIIQFLGFITLGSWANHDERTGFISNYWLIPPLALTFLLDWFSWVTVFLPLFVGFVVLYIIINKWTPFKFGFADVFGLPFSLYLTALIGIPALLGYAVSLGVQTALFDRLPWLIVGKKDQNGNIRFLPLVFNSYLLGLALYLLSTWLL